MKALAIKKPHPGSPKCGQKQVPTSIRFRFRQCRLVIPCKLQPENPHTRYTLGPNRPPFFWTALMMASTYTAAAMIWRGSIS
jgi:hypothetical protein